MKSWTTKEEIGGTAEMDRLSALTDSSGLNHPEAANVENLLKRSLGAREVCFCSRT